MEQSDDASRYAWACGVFGLKREASPQDVRGAILSHLDDADFMPPVGWRQAIRRLCDSKTPQAGPEYGYDAFREARENDFAEEVDRFATEFFALPPGPRRVKWTQLLKQVAEFPRLRARLSSWQPGLEAESVTPDGPQEAILVERIRRLFLLKPGDQDAQRRQWLESMTGDWQTVVRRVRAKCPRLAQLDSDFLAALVSPSHGTAAAKPAAALAANTNLAAAFVKAPNATAASKFTPARTNTSSGSSSGMGRGGYLVWILLFGLIRGLATQFSNSNSTPNYQNPSNSQYYRENNEKWKKPRNPSGTEGNFPYESPLPTTSVPAYPGMPSSTVNEEAAERIRESLGLPRVPSKDSPPFSSPALNGTSSNANPWEQSLKGLGSPSLPSVTPPPVSPSPNGSVPPGPVTPRGSPR